jgi:hypothetical protein
MHQQAFGWVVEVSSPAGNGERGKVRRYLVAEPNRLEAVATVRRRVRVAPEATVKAVEMLSRSSVYTRHRLKRGELVQIA